MKPNNNENTPSNGGSLNLLGVALIATGLYLLYKWSKSAPTPAPEPTPAPTLKEQLAKIPDFKDRVNLAAAYYKVDISNPKDFEYPSHSSLHGRHTVDGYFGALSGAAERYNTLHQLNGKFTDADFFALENELLTGGNAKKILADIAFVGTGRYLQDIRGAVVKLS
jgi:hypothetical protein